MFLSVYAFELIRAVFKGFYSLDKHALKVVLGSVSFSFGPFSYAFSYTVHLIQKTYLLSRTERDYNILPNSAC